ncbi:hypothetical protein ACHAW6_001896 [Cyclotella cf. meneghiniana]
MAVLRSKGLLSGGPVALSTGSNLRQLAVQGPTLLNDPNDAVASFVCAINPKRDPRPKSLPMPPRTNSFSPKIETRFNEGPTMINPDMTQHWLPVRWPWRYRGTSTATTGTFHPITVSSRPSRWREKTKKTATTTEMMRRNRSSLQRRDKTTALPAANEIHPSHSMQTKISSEGALIHNDDDDKLAYGIWAPPYASE